MQLAGFFPCYEFAKMLRIGKHNSKYPQPLVLGATVPTARPHHCPPFSMDDKSSDAGNLMLQLVAGFHLFEKWPRQLKFIFAQIFFSRRKVGQMEPRLFVPSTFNAPLVGDILMLGTHSNYGIRLKF